MFESSDNIAPRRCLANSSAVARAMPDVGPVMMYAVRSEGFSETVFDIVTSSKLFLGYIKTLLATVPRDRHYQLAFFQQPKLQQTPGCG